MWCTRCSVLSAWIPFVSQLSSVGSTQAGTTRSLMHSPQSPSHAALCHIVMTKTSDRPIWHIINSFKRCLMPIKRPYSEEKWSGHYEYRYNTTLAYCWRNFKRPFPLYFHWLSPLEMDFHPQPCTKIRTKQPVKMAGWAAMQQRFASRDHQRSKRQRQGLTRVLARNPSYCEGCVCIPRSRRKVETTMEKDG